MKIHSAGGTKTLFEWYMDMDIMVQLESLAAIANLTLSTEVTSYLNYHLIPRILYSHDYLTYLPTSNACTHTFALNDV